MTNPDEIIRVAARGDGITADGRHAARAAPRDLLAADGTITPGPHHQVAPCRHFPQCGGCQLQHLDDASYAGFITDRIASALAAQGLEAPIRPPLLSPPRTRRRATLHAERKGGQILLGFNAAQSHAIVDIRQCEILSPSLFALVAPLRSLLARLGGKGRRWDVHLTEADQGPDLLLTGLDADGLQAAEILSAFCERHGVARLSLDSGLGPETRWEPRPVTVTLGGVPVPLPPGAFLQATPEGEGALVAAVGDARRILIVDECRITGSQSEALMALFVEHTPEKTLARLAADDSFIPLGRAATLTLPSRDSIVASAKELLAR